MFRYFLICVIMQAAGAVMIGLYQYGIDVPVLAGFAIAFALFGMILTQETTSVAAAGGDTYGDIEARLNDAHRRERGPDIPDLDAVWQVIKTTVGISAATPAKAPTADTSAGMVDAPRRAA